MSSVSPRPIAGVFIVLLIFFVFSAVLKNELLEWDDQAFILNNPMIQSLSLDNIKMMATSLYFGVWHPLTWFSHAVDYHLFKLDPAGHHFTNLVLHCLNALWVFILFTRLAGNESGQSAGIVAGGMIATILFGIHPLRVESVAWASERKDLLCSFFILATYSAYLSYVSAEDRKIRARWYVAMLLLMILALMSKSMAVTIPLVMLILDVYPLKRWQSASQGFKLIVEKIPLFALSLIVGSATLITLRESGRLISSVSVDLTDRILNASMSLLFYIEKTFWPTNLIPLYPLSKSAPIISVWRVMPFIVVTATTLYMVWMLSRKRWFFPATWFYYLITVAPVLGIIQAGSHVRADRYTYLTTLSFYFLIGIGVARLWDTESASGNTMVKSSRAMILTVSVIAMSLLSHLTIRQIGVWRNSEVFWTYVADSLPNRYAQADFVLGKYLSEKGMIQEAEAKYKQALENDPDYVAALNALGYIYEGRGMYQEAVKYYWHAIESQPNYPNIHLIHNSLALIYIKTNQLEKAESALREALRLSSTDAEVHSSLGILYHTMGRLQDAEREYKEAISLEFKHSVAHLNLGMLYKEMGLLDKAMIEFKRDIYPDQFRESIQKLIAEIDASTNPATNN